MGEYLGILFLQDYNDHSRFNIDYSYVSPGKGDIVLFNE